MNEVTKPESLRVFVAVAIPDEVNARLAALQEWLRRQPGREFIRWVRTEKFHLTLRFFGDLLVTKLPLLEEALRKIAAVHNPIELIAAGAGWFGHRQQPGVVWAGIGGDVKSLRAVESALARATDHLGARRDPKPFEPHLTLGRVGGCSPAESRHLKEIIASKANVALGSWRVEALQLLLSKNLPTGASYTELGQYRLGRGVDPITSPGNPPCP